MQRAGVLKPDLLCQIRNRNKEKYATKMKETRKPYVKADNHASNPWKSRKQLYKQFPSGYNHKQ
jgi:hypothetical protein